VDLGTSILVLRVAAISLLYLLLLGVVLLGRMLCSWVAGLWGATLASLCVPVVASSWTFTLDLPLGYLEEAQESDVFVD